jgi:predicted DNA-binding transcriptional regulator YafY
VQKANHQKIKLLLLYTMLQQETDESFPLTTNQLCKRLTDLGITCDRRTLSTDIDLLNAYDYEVMSKPLGREKAYYVEDRKFSLPELKILIDAVQAAHFITPKKTEALIDKLSSLGGFHRGELLKRNQGRFHVRKHTNEEIYYAVEALECALQQKKKASFLYFDRDEHGNKKYRRDKQRYITEPVSLVFSDDNYYLLSYHDEQQKLYHYRVDRMESVQVLEEPISPEAVAAHGEVPDYTGQLFRMFAGATEQVTLEFQDSLIGVVQDRFGEDTKMIRTGDDRCCAEVEVQVSPTFWGWLFQMAGQMKILAPESLAEAYRQRALLICGDTKNRRMIPMKPNYEEMLSELEEYYECAGFADAYERILKGRSPEEIAELYQELICDEERHAQDVLDQQIAEKEGV